MSYTIIKEYSQKYKIRIFILSRKNNILIKKIECTSFALDRLSKRKCLLSDRYK